MATNDDEPMHLYEVFQNCFNKIANKQQDKSRDMTYPMTYPNPSGDAISQECLNTFPGVELLPVGDAYFQYSGAVQQRLLPGDPVRGPPAKRKRDGTDPKELDGHWIPIFRNMPYGDLSLLGLVPKKIFIVDFTIAVAVIQCGKKVLFNACSNI